jgi:hypothetical protein
MIRTRSAALLTTLVLGSAGIVASTVAPAGAVPLEPGQGNLTGLVTDRDGGYLDGVEVVAHKANGAAEASDSTYEDVLEHEYSHGFYRLYVHAPGTYRVTYELDGYVTRKVAGVKVRNGQVRKLPTVTLLPEPKPSETSARLKDMRITTSERGKVVVSVTSDARPTGDVAVRYGRKVVGDGVLRRADKGAVTVTLDKLDRGTYPLKVYYGGSEAVAGSKSKELKLTVEKPRGHHRPEAYRPNVRATF